ncbi:MAG: hypothetical protein U0796_00225 [Gemmatales bacterium]
MSRLLKAMVVELQQAQQRSQRTIDGLQQRLEQLLKRHGPRARSSTQAYALFPN